MEYSIVSTKTNECLICYSETKMLISLCKTDHKICGKCVFSLQKRQCPFCKQPITIAKSKYIQNGFYIVKATEDTQGQNRQPNLVPQERLSERLPTMNRVIQVSDVRDYGNTSRINDQDNISQIRRDHSYDYVTSGSEMARGGEMVNVVGNRLGRQVITTFPRGFAWTQNQTISHQNRSNTPSRQADTMNSSPPENNTSRAINYSMNQYPHHGSYNNIQQLPHNISQNPNFGDHILPNLQSNRSNNSNYGVSYRTQNSPVSLLQAQDYFNQSRTLLSNRMNSQQYLSNRQENVQNHVREQNQARFREPHLIQQQHGSHHSTIQSRAHTPIQLRGHALIQLRAHTAVQGRSSSSLQSRADSNNQRQGPNNQQRSHSNNMRSSVIMQQQQSRPIHQLKSHLSSQQKQQNSAIQLRYIQSSSNLQRPYDPLFTRR